jgi:hypothetical protein
MATVEARRYGPACQPVQDDKRVAACQDDRNDDVGGFSLADTRADDVYGRAQRDAIFLDRVREAHGGRWDVLDALWWESRPLDAAPSGAPAPAAELRELQRRLFSQGGDAGGDHATTVVMRELETTIAAERAAIKDAIEQAQSQPGKRPPHQTDVEITHLFDLEPGLEVGSSGPTSPVLGTAAPKRNLAVAFSIAAALVGGVVVGTQLTGGTADAAPPLASPSPTARPTVNVGALAPVEVFERAQETWDIPDLALPPIFDAASFRSLNHHPPESTYQPPAKIYAARMTSNLMCLVAVISADDYVSTCTLERNFPITGLRVYWKAPMETMPIEGGDPVSMATDQHAVWSTDGSLMWGSTG